MAASAESLARAPANDASGALALFDTDGCLVCFSAAWTAMLPHDLATKLSPGLSFVDLVDMEIRLPPLSRLEDAQRLAWRNERLQRFEAGDGQALELGVGRGRRLRIRAQRMNDGSTVLCHDYSGADTDTSRALENKLGHLVTHDDLTGLLNRLGLKKALDRMLANATEESSGRGVCYLDIDQFQVLNDTGGYAAGDALLNALAAIIIEQAGPDAAVARIGGDEFAIAIANIEKNEIVDCARSICAAIRAYTFEWEEQPFRITASVGVVHSARGPDTSTDLVRAADSACYAAKDSGRDRVKVFSHDDSTLNLRHGRMHWVARINSALKEDRFELNVQPIAPTVAGDDSYLHYEVLVRMRLRDGRQSAPGEFLPAAEHYNLITELDRWILDRSIRYLDDNVLFQDHLHTLSINVSGRSLGDPVFRDHVVQTLGSRPRIAKKLCFEVTETAVINKLAEGQQFIHQMRELGCRFALDDFGAGLSSFAYLKELDVEYLKIDGLFVRDIDRDPVHAAMVRSINEVGHVMGKKTIAEFVESDAIRAVLAEIGVDYVQGYGIGKPVPFDDIL